MEEKNKMSRWGWLEIATRGIRFRPDREEVRAELYAHFEDKIADLQRIFPDLSPREAEQWAVAQMGDPEQVGRELAKLHQPWLGYLWRVSQVLLTVLTLLLAVTMVWGSGVRKITEATEIWQENREYRAITRVLYGNGSAAELGDQISFRWDGLERLALYDLNRETRLGEATVTLKQGALWREEDGQTLYLQIRLEHDRAESRSDLLFPFYLQAEDSLGNHYGHVQKISGTGASISGLGFDGKKTGWRADTWNVRIDDLPEEAEWVRLSYALRPNVDLGFFVDLREEGTP